MNFARRYIEAWTETALSPALQRLKLRLPSSIPRRGSCKMTPTGLPGAEASISQAVTNVELAQIVKQVAS